jgi:hypothetical protein
MDVPNVNYFKVSIIVIDFIDLSYYKVTLEMDSI